MSPGVTVLGSGSWGTALAVLLCQNFRRVVLWGRNADAIEAMVQDRCNRRYLPDVPFPDNLVVESRFEAIPAQDPNYLVVVPSHGFRETLVKLDALLTRNAIDRSKVKLVWGTKGFDPSSGSLLSDVARDVLGAEASLGVVSGPSFAVEMAHSLPTALTVGSFDLDTAEDMAGWFHTNTTRIYFSDDITGVQLGGAVKNVIAIAAGISDGLGYGANARAALITRGLSELTRLGTALGGRPETFMGLTGMGDLVLTCTDDQSRNRRFGLGLGMGKPRETVVSEIGQEIEGINTVRELNELAHRAGIDMPITRQVYLIIHEGKPPQDAVNALLQRNPKSES